MKPKEPTISVVMSVYNAERYLAEAVESILGQSFTDFEFLIIDDGSTDGSLAILKQYAARDGRIHLISRPNTGLAAALNEGLFLARGEFVARMDADDIAFPDRFERQVAYLRDHPDCVVVGGQVLVIEPRGAPLFVSAHPLDHEGIERRLLEGYGGVLPHPAAMMRRSAVLAVGGYANEYVVSQDLDLYLRLAECGQLANLPEVLLKYRQHPDSAASARGELQRRLATAIVAEAKRRRGDPVPEDFRLPWDHRPSDPLDQKRRWFWGTLKNGHVGVARRYALDILRQRPIALGSWKILYCALRGH